MKLSYAGKQEPEAFLRTRAIPIGGLDRGWKGSLLIHGENADVMRALIKHHGLAGKIDLVYIDPPFATNTTFRIGEHRTATISSRNSDRVAYEDNLEGAQFIEFLRERLVLIRELLSERGSIYLHIDYKIGQYVKVAMDEIFGFENFRNDITRIKCNPKNFSRRGYGNIKDLVLFYSKTDRFIWNEPRESVSREAIERLYKKKDSNGRRYTTVPVHAPGETASGPTSKPWRGMLPPKGRHWRCDPAELDRLDAEGLIEWSKTGNPRRINYAEDAERRGKKLQDIWDFKDQQYPEYPTQKNMQMLETIVSASSNSDSVVLDCFCGSGTTLIAAEKLGRRWIGVDQSDPGIEVAKRRLSDVGLFSREYVDLRHRAQSTEGSNQTIVAASGGVSIGVR